MAKSFKKQANRPSVYDVVTDATPEEYAALTAPKEYTAQETQEARDNMKTQGKRGVKALRINMAFTPTNADFIHTMARLHGETLTKYVNDVLDAERERNGEAYEKAKEIINSL